MVRKSISKAKNKTEAIGQEGSAIRQKREALKRLGGEFELLQEAAFARRTARL